MENDDDVLTFGYTAAERRRRTLALVQNLELFLAEREQLLSGGVDYRKFMSGRGYDATCWEVAVAALRAARVIT